MFNEKDEKYEGPEESEYHYSDDEVSYEVEPEAPVKATNTKEAILKRLTSSKRMLISLVVFFILIFVVYKMVGPATSTPPSTEITAENPISPPLPKHQVAATQQPALPTTSNVIPVASSPPVVPSPVVTMPQTTPVVREVPQAPQIAPPIAQPQQMPAQAAAPIQAPPMQAPAQAPMPQTQVAVQMPQVQMPPAQMPQAQMPQTQMPQTQMPQAQMPTQQAPMPQAQTPVQGQLPNQAQLQVEQPVTLQPTTYSTTTPNMVSFKQQNEMINSSLATLASQNERLITQLQADYTQKLNDFSAQSKTVQNQLQSLSTRVASMEAQLSQLVQTLSSRTVDVKTTTVEQGALPVEQTKIPYNVQAIIPGRAWLKSFNGETLTVAEGDLIKGVGRVSKIDPYDGIVEINTGNKIVSLSYGSGE